MDTDTFSDVTFWFRWLKSWFTGLAQHEETKHYLLVVEDTKSHAEIMAYLFRRSKQKFDVVSTSEGALDLVNRNNYSIAFIDIRLPYVSGIQLAEKMRMVSPKTHIILMTSHNHELTEMPEGIYFGIIVKPITLESVEDSLNKTVK